MDYMKNGSLADLISKEEKSLCPTNYDNTKRQIILIGIARGMMILHKLCIIHRDLKPENVLLDDDYHPHITDFGLSKFFDPSHSMNQSMTNTGTAAYMAPEVIESENFNTKADVYSFGVLMYEVLTGKRAYADLLRGRNKISIFKLKTKVCQGLRPKIEEGTMKKSHRIMIEKCWSQNPKDRPTFSELYRKLSLSSENDIFQFEAREEKDVIEFENDEDDEDDDDNEEEVGLNTRFCLNSVNFGEILNYIEDINADPKSLSHGNNDDEIEKLKKVVDELKTASENQEKKLSEKEKVIWDLKLKVSKLKRASLSQEKVITKLSKETKNLKDEIEKMKEKESTIKKTPEPEREKESTIKNTQEPESEPEKESTIKNTQEPESEPEKESTIKNTQEPESEPEKESTIKNTQEPESEREKEKESTIKNTPEPESEREKESTINETKEPESVSSLIKSFLLFSCRFSAENIQNGIISNLEENSVSLTAGGSQFSEYPLSGIIKNNESLFFNTNNYTPKSEYDSFIQFDFGPLTRVDLFSYLIRSNRFGEMYQHPKTWRIEGSNDNIAWTLLDKRENNDSLRGSFKESNFECQQAEHGSRKDMYRYIRFVQQDSWRFKCPYFVALSYIELYGDVFDVT